MGVNINRTQTSNNYTTGAIGTELYIFLFFMLAVDDPRLSIPSSTQNNKRGKSRLTI